MVLFMHNRYRVTGGEERVVENLMWLVREYLGEEAQLLERDSAALRRDRAALGLLRGGLRSGEVEDAVRSRGAGIVHAHNVQPTFGWRALHAAREAGARVVLHLHQYRLVCAIGVCFTRGAPCTRCHGRNTLPGVALRCRGSVAESVLYGASLARSQRRIAEAADVVLVPSDFALVRLRELDAPLPWERTHVLRPPLRAFASSSSVVPSGYALAAARLSPEKGIDVAIDACRIARVPLVIAGDGPERAALEARASTAPRSVRFVGAVDSAELERLRAGASLALVPSRSENFPMAAAEAMAAGLPVVACRVGGVAELVEDDGLVPPDDPVALAHAIERRLGDVQAGARGLEHVRSLCAPEAVATQLADAYGRALRRDGHTSP
jgi:glycosyltransferase involved in cell wall biosynthesis